VFYINPSRRGPVPVPGPGCPGGLQEAEKGSRSPGLKTPAQGGFQHPREIRGQGPGVPRGWGAPGGGRPSPKGPRQQALAVAARDRNWLRRYLVLTG